MTDHIKTLTQLEEWLGRISPSYQKEVGALRWAIAQLKPPVKVDDSVQRDYENWLNGNTLQYAGFTVKPSQDFGIGPHPEPGKHGWVVVKDGCNPIPGATWAHSMVGAQQLIDVYMAVGGDDLPPVDNTKASRAAHAQRFWHLLRAIQAGAKP